MSLLKNIIIDHNFTYRFNPAHYIKFVNNCRVKTVFLYKRLDNTFWMNKNG